MDTRNLDYGPAISTGRPQFQEICRLAELLHKEVRPGPAERPLHWLARMNGQLLPQSKSPFRPDVVLEEAGTGFRMYLDEGLALPEMRIAAARAVGQYLMFGTRKRQRRNVVVPNLMTDQQRHSVDLYARVFLMPEEEFLDNAGLLVPILLSRYYHVPPNVILLRMSDLGLT